MWLIFPHKIVFAKHARQETQRIRQVWTSIPAQLARENKKFIFGAVRKGARAAAFDSALQWLKDAAVTYKVVRNTNPTLPLSFYADSDAFKLFLLDVGLLSAMVGVHPYDMLSDDKVFVEFKGAFTENYVLQQLIASGIEQVYYFSKDNSSMKIDFMVEGLGKAIPIEVKAEENVKAKSLKTFIQEEYKTQEFKGVRFSMLPYVDQQWMENVPLWAVGFWAHNLTLAITGRRS